MTVIELPANLKLLRPGMGIRTTSRATREPVAPIVSRAELLERLETIGELAPNGPLSYLLVRIEGLDSSYSGGLSPRQVMGMMGMRIISLTRPTDTVGDYSGNAFGIVLQGTGATAAGAVAARISFHLMQLGEGLGVATRPLVYAATGTGINADLLPMAAIDSLDDCS